LLEALRQRGDLPVFVRGKFKSTVLLFDDESSCLDVPTAALAGI
jgi:hypothetical protein